MPDRQQVDEELECIAVVKENSIVTFETAVSEIRSSSLAAIKNFRSFPSPIAKRLDEPSNIMSYQHFTPGLRT